MGSNESTQRCRTRLRNLTELLVTNPSNLHPSIFKIKTYDDSNSRIAEVVRAC